MPKFVENREELYWCVAEFHKLLRVSSLGALKNVREKLDLSSGRNTQVGVLSP